MKHVRLSTTHLCVLCNSQNVGLLCANAVVFTYLPFAKFFSVLRLKYFQKAGQKHIAHQQFKFTSSIIKKTATRKIIMVKLDMASAVTMYH